MGESIPLGRACGSCGGQVVLSVETERSEYTDDLAGLLNANIGESVVVRVECDCPTPRKVALEGASFAYQSL